MYQLYGFMVINSLIDNQLNQVSKLGELSSQSRSYSREIGIYSHPNFDNVRLWTFFSGENNQRQPLENHIAEELLAFGEWFSQQALLNRVDENRRITVQLLNAEYNTKYQILQVGKMVNNGSYWLPEYVTFSRREEGRKNRYKIWFADEAFQHQYDKYEIEVIPPLVNIDDFHKGAVTVKQRLTDHTLEKLHNRVNKKANEKPYTVILTNDYGYINPLDKKDITMTSWTVIIYGEAGKNSDVVRDAIAEWVLANSDYTQEEWEKIIPDLFVPTEFYLCPVWNRFATDNLQVKGGIYSPVIPYREIIPFAKRTMVGYHEDNLKANSVTFGTIYKSIAVVACGHERNRTVSPKFEEVWPEYCNIYTTSRDFNRISPTTQQFILFMNTLFLEAETVTPDSEIPQDFTRVRRGDMWYLTGRFNSVTYLTPLRWNFLTEIEGTPENKLHLPVLRQQGKDEIEMDNRIRDVLDITPSIGKGPDFRRGRQTIGLTEGSRDETISTTEKTQDKDGIAGTVNDGIDETPAASRTGSNPRRVLGGGTFTPSSQ